MGIHTHCPAPAPMSMNLNHARACVLLLVFLMPSVTAQLQNSPPPPPPPLDSFTRLRFDKTMAAVLVILVVVFFAFGFVSIYTRQCAERRIRGRLDLAVAIAGGMERRQPRGLDVAVVDTFPTFVYCEVKALKIGRATLECAVCLNEFRDDETLRLIPKCCHVFHPDCIDAWLANHCTCPVCRANLAPKPEDAPSSVEIQVSDLARPIGPNEPNTEPGHDPNYINPVEERESEHNRIVTEPPRVLDDPNRVRPVRSKSTGFGIARLFPRSHSTGHSLIRPGEDCERFTLRLPEEVRDRLVRSSTLNRTKSCGMTWQLESSGRRGYRTRSVGGGGVRAVRWGRPVGPVGFMWTPPYWGRTGSVRSPKATRVKDEVDVGERSADRLFSKD